MVNTLADIARWTYAWILVGFAHLDKIAAYYEQALIDYATEAERQRVIRDLEKAQRDLLEAVEGLRELDARGIGLHNKGERDEQEQAIHG